MARSGPSIGSVAGASRFRVDSLHIATHGMVNSGSTSANTHTLDLLRGHIHSVPENMTSNDMLIGLLKKIPRRALESNAIPQLNKLRYDPSSLVRKNVSAIPGAPMVRMKQNVDDFLKAQLNSSYRHINPDGMNEWRPEGAIMATMGHDGDQDGPMNGHNDHHYEHTDPHNAHSGAIPSSPSSDTCRAKNRELSLKLLEYQGYDHSVVQKVGEIMDAVSQECHSIELVKDMFAGLSNKLADFKLVHSISSLIIQNTEHTKRNGIRNAFARVKCDMLTRMGHNGHLVPSGHTMPPGKVKPMRKSPATTLNGVGSTDRPLDDVDVLLAAIKERNPAPTPHQEPTSIPSQPEHKVELMDYSKFTTQARKREPENVQYISHLSCENLLKVLNIFGVDGIDKRMKELALEIDSGLDKLTLEEAEFILGEMGLLSSFKVYTKGGKVAIERRDELVKRPIVVTIMGHVDHGKTTLLDRIQRTNIVDTEHGHITQKLGAFQVETARGKITFVDTPGHAAFTTMRSRGLQCADVVILVVSVDDGIMPQTLEALDLIKKQQMPCIVAINKMDLGTPEMMEALAAEMKRHLPDSSILAISAKNGHIETLLDEIYGITTILDIKTSLSSNGQGYVYEVLQHPTRGRCLNIIVRDGTFKEGSWITCGGLCGKIRRMYDASGKQIRTAVPSQIVQVSWTQGIDTSAGMFVTQYDSFSKANELAILHAKRMMGPMGHHNDHHDDHYGVAKLPPPKASAAIHSCIPEIKVILRCGDQGSLDAVVEWIRSFNAKQRESVDVSYLVERGYVQENADVELLLTSWNPISIISKQIGPFNVNDANTAETGQVSFLGFNVDFASGIKLPQIARTHKIIYHLFKDIEEMFKHYFGPTYVMKREATLQVTRLGTTTLKQAGKKMVIGTVVKNGTAHANSFFILTRHGKTIARDLVAMSMHSSKRSVAELQKGDGNNAIILNQDVDVRVGDELVAYSKEPLPPLFDTTTDCILKRM